MIPVMWRKVLCPFCFRKFRLREAWFRCRNPNQAECPEEIDKEYSDHIGVPNRMLPKVFPPPPTRVWQSLYEAECPNANCGKTSTIRICPHCHSKLPSQLGYVDSKIIAVVGGTSSGKSHYIATMVTHLREMAGPNLQIPVMGVGDTTKNNYRTYYYDPVYGQKALLPQTQQARVNPVVREPLIWRLQFQRQFLRQPAVNLVLFDAAGEDVQDENTLALYNKYIHCAAGIIFLVNPLQLTAVTEQLGIDTDDGEIINDTLDRVIEQLQIGLKIRPGQSIKIPTAFVLSKSDILAPLAKNAAFLKDVLHVDEYDIGDAEMVSEEVKSYLSRWGGDGLISAASKFDPHGFFALSALGCNPDRTKMKIPSINPIRVSDPILWLLAQMGYLKR